MRHLHSRYRTLLVLLVFVVMGAAAAQAMADTRIGVLPQPACMDLSQAPSCSDSAKQPFSAADRISLAKVYGVDVLRTETSLPSLSAGSQEIVTQAAAAGLGIVLTVRNHPARDASGNNVTPGLATPAAEAQYRSELTALLAAYKPELLVIENEENAPNFFGGTSAQYLTELSIAAEVAHAAGVKLSNGGITSPYAFLLTWEDYHNSGQDARADEFAIRTLTGSSLAALLPYLLAKPYMGVPNDNPRNQKLNTLWQMSRELVAGYGATGTDYVNFHWYFPNASALEDVVGYFKRRTGKPAITHEIGQYRIDGAQVTDSLATLRKLDVPYAVWFDGDGDPAFALHNGDNSLRENGNALAAFDANPSAAAPVPQNQFGVTGPWFNPATAGQGLFVSVTPSMDAAQPGQFFATWYTYDVAPAGGVEKQHWYTLQGLVSSTSASNTFGIYDSQGGNFDAPPLVNPVPVGYATLQLADCTHATLSYLFTDGSGRSASMPLTRVTANVACTPSGTPGWSGAPLLSGAWYEPATSGQGLVIEANPINNVLSAGWMTYAPNGSTLGSQSQRWFTLQGDYAAGSNTTTVGIYDAIGGVFDAPIPVSAVLVGNATVSVGSCSAISVQYQFTSGENAGRTGTLDLARLSPPPPGCSLPDQGNLYLAAQPELHPQITPEQQPVTWGAAPSIDASYGKTLYAGTAIAQADPRPPLDAQGNQPLRLWVAEPGNDLTNRPAILWVHGGGFAVGIDSMYQLAATDAAAYAQRGYVGFSVEYRIDTTLATWAPIAGQRPPSLCQWVQDNASLAGDPVFEERKTQCERNMLAAQYDIQAALRWVRAHAAEYRVDPDRIVIAGFSAGAVTAANADFSEDVGTQRYFSDDDLSVAHSAPAAALGFSGCYTPSFENSSSGIDANDGPLMLVQSRYDPAVDYSCAAATVKASVAAGVPTEFRTYCDSNLHAGSLYASDKAAIDAEIVVFLARSLGLYNDLPPPPPIQYCN